MMPASCSGGQRRQIHLGRAPPLVTQSAARGRLGRDVADEPHHVRVAGGRLGGGAFHAVDHRLQGDIARQGVAALSCSSRTAAPICSSEYEAMSSIRKSTRRESRWRMARICSAPSAGVLGAAAAGRGFRAAAPRCSRRASSKRRARPRKARRETESRKSSETPEQCDSNWWLQNFRIAEYSALTGSEPGWPAAAVPIAGAQSRPTAPSDPASDTPSSGARPSAGRRCARTAGPG